MLDLYARLVCALTHDLEACENCGMCGKNPAEARMNLIDKLAKEMGRELPWTEDEEEND